VSTPDTRSDRELLQAHIDGERHAFGELVTRHQQRAWAVALRTLGDAGDAEDAVQEAFLSALRGAASFRGDAQVSTWLHRIVVNACLDRVRRRTARPTVALPDQLPSSVDVVETPDPATAMDVRAALQALPDDQRIAIVLIDVEDWSVSDAAELLGVAEGTIKSRCHRGRAKLAIALGHLRPSGLPGNRPGMTSVQTPTPGGET
jgi:RNA polymerase sigma-70 factor (ECF subfamily)